MTDQDPKQPGPEPDEPTPPAAGGTGDVPPPPPPPPSGEPGDIPIPPPPPPPAADGFGAVPPPYGPAAGAAPVARPRFSAGEAISYGWDAFKANAGPLVLTILMILLINTLLSWLGPSSSVLDDNLALAPFEIVVSVAWSVLQVFVSLLLGLGVIRVALAVLDGRTPYVNDLVSTRGLLPYTIATLLFAVIVTIGLILCIIPGLIAGFLLQFYAFAILDDRSGGEADPIAALRRSLQITSNNVGGLILLALACIGINIIGAMLCGLGLLVSIPVSWIAIAYAWRFFTNGTIAPQNA
jgi:uncharacterized membrane protein